MFSHTLFSLPFALLTMFIAADGLPNRMIIFWGIIALVGGRTGANAFNRYADRLIDYANPRTRNRHLPEGTLKVIEVIGVTIVSYLIYFFAAYQINNLCFYLSPIPILIFTIYPYTKRFTFLCHVFLGIAAGMAVLGAWMAVTNELFTISLSTNNNFLFQMNVVPMILFIAVMLWNAGFDTIYGTQDIEHDRKNNIYSIPAKFGLKNALWIARLFHFTMILLLISLVFFTQLGIVYLLGIFISSLFFLLEHKIVQPHNRVIMKLASYKLNQIISVTIFIFGTIDIFFF